MSEEREQLLFTLLKLSEEKEIPYTKRQLEKLSPEKLEMIYKQYKEKELDEFNEAMTDVVISKLDEFMKKYDYIKKDSQLGLKLQNKKLFRSDLKSAISWISPMLPFIGILEGSVTIVGEVFDNYANKNAASSSEKRNKSNKNQTEATEDNEKSETENPTMHDQMDDEEH